MLENLRIIGAQEQYEAEQFGHPDEHPDPLTAKDVAKKGLDYGVAMANYISHIATHGVKDPAKNTAVDLAFNDLMDMIDEYGDQMYLKGMAGR